MSSRQLDGMVMELDEQGDIARFLYDEKGERVTDVLAHGKWEIHSTFFRVIIPSLASWK